MKITFAKTRDILTPDLRARMAKAQNPKRALEAMGLVVVSMAQRAFTQSSLRPIPWAPLKPATIKAKKKAGHGTRPLISTGALSHSPRIIAVTGAQVTVGSDRKAGGHSLASIHQLGTKDGRIPARPVWPFDKSGKLTTKAKQSVLTAARRSLDLERS